MAMMDQLVHALAKDFFRFVAEHACGGPVNKGATTVQVVAVDALQGRIQERKLLVRRQLERRGVQACVDRITHRFHKFPV